MKQNTAQRATAEDTWVLIFFLQYMQEQSSPKRAMLRPPSPRPACIFKKSSRSMCLPFLPLRLIRIQVVLGRR